MSVEGKYRDLMNTVGEATAHYLYPNDFEYYAMSFELVSRSETVESTIDYFVFPIMPKNYSNSQQTMTNIRQSNGGVLSIRNSRFIPRKINISGDFGRNFKFLLGTNQISARAFRWSTASGNFTGGDLQIKTGSFNPQLKTGYGTLKILEAICNKSKGLDNKGYPYVLYFYNPALGENYIVEIESFKIEQDVSNSRVWSYSLSMNAIGLLRPSVDLITRGPFSRELTTKSVSAHASALMGLL